MLKNIIRGERNEKPLAEHPEIKQHQADFLSTLETHGCGIHGISHKKVRPLIIESEKMQDLIRELKEKDDNEVDLILKRASLTHNDL